VNLIEVIQSAIRIMNYQIKENGFEFETDISSDEIEIWADADTIIEAITNLISNAIKYSSDEKYICISLETNADYAIIRIRDKGIGIEASEKEKIFETFYRSSDQRIQAAGGAGLGLSLVRHVVEAHRGEVTVESEPGKGSTFSLSLPIGKIQ
jgi:signal transduction histidine kinase